MTAREQDELAFEAALCVVLALIVNLVAIVATAV